MTIALILIGSGSALFSIVFALVYVYKLGPYLFRGVTGGGAIYSAAKACLHRHITLNESVPPEVGCAEAVSYVLHQAGVPGIPAGGFAGTYELYQWLQGRAQAVSTPLPGDVVISPTGTSNNGSTHGHTGIVGMYGILSNDSDTGLFLEKYTEDTWVHLFSTVLGFPTLYFRLP